MSKAYHGIQDQRPITLVRVLCWEISGLHKRLHNCVKNHPLTAQMLQNICGYDTIEHISYIQCRAFKEKTIQKHVQQEPLHKAQSSLHETMENALISREMRISVSSWILMNTIKNSISLGQGSTLKMPSEDIQPTKTVFASPRLFVMEKTAQHTSSSYNLYTSLTEEDSWVHCAVKKLYQKSWCNWNCTHMEKTGLMIGSTSS